MQCSINDFALSDGTLSGGYALGEIRIGVARIADVAIPLQSVNPVVFNRDIHKTAFDFVIARIHASFAAADKYICDHDALIPSSGDVKFTTSDGSIRYIINAELITHTRIGIVGKATAHAYHIEGGRIHTHPAYYRLLEDGYYRLLEDGGKRELEHG